MKRYLTTFPVSYLINYREFDRVNNPIIPIPFFQMETVDSIEEKIKQDGLQTPLTLGVWGTKCLLVDGNHRIAALSRLKRNQVACYVEIYETEDEFRKDLSKPTRERFIAIRHDIINIINALKLTP